MRLLDLTLPTAESNLAFDEALFRRMESAALEGCAPGRFEVLRFWESPRPVVVLGRSGRIDQDVRVDACRRGRVPLRRRASGGGTVLLGRGCLCFALVLSYESHPGLRGVSGSYCFILGRIARALAVPGLAVRGADLALGDRKVSGSAQLRGRLGLLHQGTILHAFEPALIERYLREPERQPAYRARRPHAAFVGNLPLRAPELRARLAEAWKPSPIGSPPTLAVSREATDTNTANEWFQWERPL